MAWNVVVVGGGFGGAYAARKLEKLMPRQSARLTLVNDVNFLLYTSFLPEAAAGTLEPRHVVTPLRDVLKRTNLRLGAVTGHDPAARTVELSATRAASSNCPTTTCFCRSARSLDCCRSPGSTSTRSASRALPTRSGFATACRQPRGRECDGRRGAPDELLTFVFVGGGYSGLEALAELQDFAAEAISRYPKARLHGMRWILIDAADRVLPEIDAGLADYAVRELRGAGIDIRLATRLDNVTADSVTLSTGEVISTRTLVWTAGVVPQPSLRNLSVPLDESGRIVVDDHLQVAGTDNVWAIGDCAAVPDPRDPSRGCPPTAQHAVRQGPAAARNIAAALGIGAARPYRTRSSPRS